MKKSKIKILSNKKYAKESLEYQLIEYVNNDPLSIVECPVNLISKKLHMDVSSLTRTTRKLGFKNYRNFRNHVIEKIVEHRKDLLNNKSTNNLFKDSIMINSLTIKQTIEINNNDNFNKIINEIIKSKKIFLFGIGFTSFICQHFTKYLEFFNINCCNPINFYDAFQFAVSLVGNLWIILSITLQTKEIIFILEELISNKNNKIIVITANYKNPILQKVSYVLKLKSNIHIKNEMFNLNLKIALTALVNLLILGVINAINFNKINNNFIA